MMEKEYSSEFFTLFVETLQRLCTSHLTFDNMVEISGYVCVERDHRTKERYVLNELVKKGGPGVSDSFCTQVCSAPTGMSSQSASGDNDDLRIEGVDVRSRGCRKRYSEDRLDTGRAKRSEQDGSGAEMLNGKDASVSGIPNSRVTAINYAAATGSGSGDPEDDSVICLEPLIIKREIMDSVMEHEIVNAHIDFETGQNGNDSSSNHNASRASSQSQFPETGDRRYVKTAQYLKMNNARPSLPHSNGNHTDSLDLSSGFRVSRANPRVPPISSIFAQTPTSNASNVPLNVFSSQMYQAFRSNNSAATLHPARRQQDPAMFGPPLGEWHGSHFGTSQSGVLDLGSSFQLHHLMNTPGRWHRRQGLPTQRVKQNWKYAVRQFENFLRYKGHDIVPIHTIPPVQLDAMLCEFLVWVRKSNGEDFHPWSVKNFFYHLECHLKESGYAHCITKDAEFQNSRDVLKRRISELQMNLHLATGAMPLPSPGEVVAMPIPSPGGVVAMPLSSPGEL